MTSQIAIFNLNGIAVASDTVATSSSDKGKKTTNNAEKIYPLGDKHLVVALHFGGTSLNDLHHQFHFNRWVESLGKPFPTLEDYLQDYVDWSSKNPLHTEESEIIEINGIIFDHFAELVRRTRIDIEKASPENHFDFLFERLSHHAKVGLDYLKSLPKMEGITLESAKKLISDHKINIKKIFEDVIQGSWVFDNAPNLPTKIMRQLSQSAPYALIGDQELFWDSYLALVGYGAKDNFGASIKIRFRSILDNKLTYSRGELNNISQGRLQSRIQPFAQSDAIESFVQGYNQDIINAVGYPINSIGKDILQDKATEEELEKLAIATSEQVAQHSFDTYVAPMLDQIAGMNLYSMSELARTLVGLQATSSEAKAGPVSVGGLIEVLTIDRVKGVQWRSKLP